MKNLHTFEEFLNEKTLMDREKSDYDTNDIGFQLMRDHIAKHLKAKPEDIEELSNLDGFVPLTDLSPTKYGSISTYSTSTKGNFVLTCGTANGKPACGVEDELNKVYLYYIKK